MKLGIINMNGRLYAPVISRFFSPDNYMQMPDNSQSFGPLQILPERFAEVYRPERQHFHFL